MAQFKVGDRVHSKVHNRNGTVICEGNTRKVPESEYCQVKWDTEHDVYRRVTITPEDLITPQRG